MRFARRTLNLRGMFGKRKPGLRNCGLTIRLPPGLIIASKQQPKRNLKMP